MVGLAPTTLRLTGGRTTVVLHGKEIGIPGWSSTSDPRLRSAPLCVSELRGQKSLCVRGWWEIPPAALDSMARSLSVGQYRSGGGPRCYTNTQPAVQPQG